MKDEEERKLIDNIKKWLVGFFLTSVVGLTAFYFNTTYVLAQNVKDTNSNTIHIIEIKKAVNKLIIVPKINSEKIKNIESDVIEIKEGQKELRKNNQKIIELLYQIKQKQND